MMLMLVLLAAAAAPTDGKTMALDDWHELEIYGVGGEATGPRYVRVHAGDLDGDGVNDDAVLKLTCADGRLSQASYLVSPRDASSGMPTGKRQHGSITIVKEWGAASPELGRIRPTYDVKTIKTARMAQDGWTPLPLSNADALCTAAAAAIVKSKSNITNN